MVYNLITITNGIDSIKIRKSEIINYKNYFEGLQIKPYFSYWLTEIIIIKEDGYLKKIIKINKGGDEIKEEYINQKLSDNTITLLNSDFESFKQDYKNIRVKKDFKKELIIDVYSKMLSYEYFQARILENNKDIYLEETFDCELPNYYEYKIYKKEIINKSIELIKEYQKDISNE